MGVGRLAPHRITARYAKALAEIPLPVRSLTRIGPGGLAIVAETVIDDRRIRFGVLYAIPRLWITVPDGLPPVIGFVTGFDTERPELHITEPDHIEWARHPGRAARIKREAVTAWKAAQRECRG